MLRGARQLHIPMLISSCNDTGTNAGVDKFVGIIKDVAAAHQLAPFQLASIRHTLHKDMLTKALQRGEQIKGLEGRPDLTQDVLERTDNLVPVMEAEPFVEALHREAVAGGEIDMSHVVYRQVDEKTTEVRGMRFRTAPESWIKIEGSGKVGERCYVVVGVRDPQTIANIDQAIAWAKQKVEAWYGRNGATYQLYYHVYGKNGVLGPQQLSPESIELRVRGRQGKNTTENA